MFSRLHKFVLIFLLANSLVVLAAEKEAEKKPEAKKEEGKKEEPKKGEEKKGEEKKEDGKSEKKDEANELQTKVATLLAKIKASQETIEDLLKEKQRAKDQKSVSEIVKNLVNEHKSLEKNVDEYNKSRTYLQYRFPEKGLKGEREYERIEIKSLEEMEHEQTMDGRINKSLKAIRKQYEAPDDLNERRLRKKKKPKEEPSITDPVILTK